MTFTATHLAADRGTPTWSAPDPASPAGPRLDPALPVRIVEVRGNWAHVECSNGWRAWVDERRLLPAFATSAGAAAGELPVASGPANASANPTPPGWYADHNAAGTLRWWDGRRWTDDRQPAVDAGAAATSRAAGRRVGFAIVAGIGLAACAFLPWVKSGGASESAFKIDAAFLVDYRHVETNGMKIAHVLLVVAAAVVLGSFVPAMRWLVRMLGVAGALVATAFVAQSQRLVSALPDAPGLFSFLGIGVYLTLAAGILAAVLPGARHGQGAS